MSKSNRVTGGMWPVAAPPSPKKRGTSEAISSIAARGLKKPDTLTPAEIKKVCASALAQDETARKLDAVKAALFPTNEGTD